MLILVAVATVLPSLPGVLHGDDYVLLGIVSGTMPREIYPSRLDAFNVFDGRPERLRRMLDLGLVPWWADAGVRHAFWRPVSAITHWVDYTAWGTWPAPMRLHSAAWLAALIGVAYATYRQVIGSAAAAALATLGYALARPHGFNVIEISGRNTLLAAVFGVLTVLLHDRWRRAGWRIGAIAAPASFAVALLSAENAVASVAYVIAHAVVLERGPGSRRLRALLPYALVLGAWRLLYSGLGYGAAGTPDYLDPLREPAAFASAVVTQAPIFLSAAWLGPLADPVLAGPHAAVVRWLAAVIALAVLAWVLAAMLKHDPVARFWGLGQVLAVVPLCAGSGLHDRYLLIVGLGVMGVLGQLVLGLAGGASWRPRGRIAKAAAVLIACLLMVSHVVAAPWQIFRDAVGRAGKTPAPDTLPADPAIRGQVLVIVNVPPGGAGLIYWFFERALTRVPIPGQTLALTFGLPPLRIERIDANAVKVRWEGRHHVLRPPGRPLVAGHRTRLAGAEVEVTAMSGGGWPLEAIFRFDDALDAPRFRWVAWDKASGRYEPFQPPAVLRSALVR